MAEETENNAIGIRFSPQFFSLLKSVSAITKAGCVIMFKGDVKGRIPGNHINIPEPTMFTHLAASAEDLDFDTNRINIFSLNEFVKYSDLAKFPEQGIAELSIDTSITGKRYEYIKFTGGGITCRTPTADPSCFKPEHSHIPYTRDNDPMTKVGEMRFTAEMVADFAKKLRAVPTCEFITLRIDEGGIKLYIKGKMSQQITYCVPANCTKGIDSLLVKKIFKPGNVTVFPVQLFNYMKGIGGDYDIDITYAVYKGMEQMSLKATSLIPGVNPEKPMTLWLGAAECSAAANSQFDLVQ